MKIVSVDFETYYDKQVSVKGMGPVAYARALDPERDIYWIALQSNDGFRWAGSPLDMDDRVLDQLSGADRILSHNAAFDSCMWDRMATWGSIGDDFHEKLFEKWDCTSDMSACLGSPRSLAGAADTLLDHTPVSKDVRAAMKGKRFSDLNQTERNAFVNYSFSDTELCLRLWNLHGFKWSPFEQWLSRHTRGLSRKGIGIDRDLCHRQLEHARDLLTVTGAEIPWSGTRKIASRNAFFDECDKAGVPRPLTTDKKSPHWIEWLDTYGDQLPWAAAIGKYRAINRLIPILENFHGQSKWNGRFPVQLMYYGGHTGRWAGTGGLNLQNLNRSTVGGIDLRSCLVPAPGKSLVIADFAAIEAVVSLWLAGEERILALVRAGQSVYEAFARGTGRWTGGNLKRENPELYQSIKVQVLGLQYGMGAVKFQSVYKAQTGVDLGLAEAKRIVMAFRAGLPGLTAGWTRVQRLILHQKGNHGTLSRPGGEVIHYRDIRTSFTPEKQLEIRAKTLFQGQLRETEWWGGSLWENLVQATARDILCELLVDLEDQGIPVVMHVHDEVVVEVDKEDALAVTEYLEGWTGREADWTTDCPIRLEVGEREGSERYRK